MGISVLKSYGVEFKYYCFTSKTFSNIPIETLKITIQRLIMLDEEAPFVSTYPAAIRGSPVFFSQGINLVFYPFGVQSRRIVLGNMRPLGST